MDEIAFQMDIVVDEALEELIEKLKSPFGGPNYSIEEFGASKELGMLWPGGMVPYEFHNSVGK